MKATKGGQMNNLIDIFCDVDYFRHQFLPVWEAELIAKGTKKGRRQSKMTTSECMTIVIAFVDSTSLKVCHNIRIPRNRVFDGVAKREKGIMGWFYGYLEMLWA